MSLHRYRLFQLWWIASVLFCLRVSDGRAQTCFDYVDGNNAKVPIRCVRQDLTTACSWNPICHLDGDASDCCTSIPSTTAQSILQMHTNWHNCFGNVGASDDNNPPGRGQRWYAFHRQFELDFNLWREPLGYSPIESVEWCPDMILEIGHLGAGLAPGDHPAGCGTGPVRPYFTPCPGCIAFPQCLFRAGAGPAACPSAPSSVCGPAGAGSGTFTYSSLEEFRNVEEVATVLDNNFHGIMHGSVGLADRAGPDCDPFGTGETKNCYVLDVTNPSCSPRDPMFWRLHKALDDVVRSWQNLKAVDVMLVIDRSGSMSEPDSSGSTKFAAALNAVSNFADLLDTSRTDGQQNRIGIVSYASTANLDMPLTVADSTLLTGPLASTITTLSGMTPNGCTGIGLGIQKALEELCPPSGNCDGFSASGDNDRKAILLLTDGVENVPPCLKSAGASGGTCGTQCFGAGLNFTNLEFTQLVSVGFGNSGSLNGDLLTLLSERQGGVYMQNPNAPGDDLKDFFVKAFGNLTDEFLALDPKGVMEATDAASDIVEYDSCGDGRVTFASGWQQDAPRGSLRLQVTTPSFNLVRATASTAVKESTQRQWAYSRVRFPYRGESGGRWSAQLIRPHRTFVNGFTPDSFAKPLEGERIVRREIHRLCPDGCKNVLYFENGAKGRQSAYEAALKAEKESGLIDRIEPITDAAKLGNALRRQSWDLLVYAQMGNDSPQAYDSQLNELVCGGKLKAIITDTRRKAGASLLRCAGTFRDDSINWPTLEGEGQLFDGVVKLKNPGHQVSSYGLRSTASVEATAKVQTGATTQAIVARVEPGKPQNWFIDVLTDGLSRLSPVNEKLTRRTGDDFLATVRVLPSDLRSGGYDRVDARVEVEYPTVGLGTLLSHQRPGIQDSRNVRGEQLDPRAAALSRITVPTKKVTFQLYDDGTHGDVHAGNAYWSAKLAGMGTVDGMYKLRYMLDFTVGGCTTRRELVQSIFVDVNVRAGDDKVRIIDIDTSQNNKTTTFRITPADAFGNLLGPGRAGSIQCATPKECRIDPKKVVDRGDGSYDITVVTQQPVAGVRLTGFTADKDIPLPCDDCPGLARISLEGKTIPEHQKSQGSVQLTGPAPKLDLGGALVYLNSSNPLALQVPASVVIPAGKTSATFPVQVGHAHETPLNVTLSANYGGESRTASLIVTPLKRGPAKPPTLQQHFPMHPQPTRTPSPRPEMSHPYGSTHPLQEIDLSESPSRGPEDAPIVLVEFTDYQCPFCATAQETLRQLIEMHPGKIRLVSKNLPLDFHGQARLAAVAALAANRQGKFWEYRELLFKNQRAMTETDLISYAAQLKLDLKRFQSDLKDQRLFDVVDRDVKQAQALGANGTPTFFLNGQPIVGSRPLAVFNTLIEELVSKERKESAAFENR